jgi:hypothetical protein
VEQFEEHLKLDPYLWFQAGLTGRLAIAAKFVQAFLLTGFMERTRLFIM